jgi:uncharacterized protein (DUF1330 family)
MPKGYWIVRVTVQDQDNYPKYLAAAQAAFEKYEAKFLIRGGNFEPMEGQARERNVVVEFADLATALACYRSPEYQAARALRQKYAVTDFIVIEGAATGGESQPRVASLAQACQAAGPNAQSKPRVGGPLRRMLDSLILARQRQAELHLGRPLLRSGGRMTDDVERRIMQEAMFDSTAWF